MPDLPIMPTVDLQSSLDAVIAAHTAVSEGIATHAQKHEATLDSRRREAEAKRKLAVPFQVTGHGN